MGFQFANARQSPPRPARAGFSLVELMVVVGIIAVLVAIFLPSLGRAREQARRVTCLNKVRQLTAATLAYVGDNAGYLPDAGSANVPAEAPLSPRTHGKPPWTPVGNAYVLPSIGGLLDKYLRGGGASVWRCPSASEDVMQEAFVLRGADPYNGTARHDPSNPAGDDAFRPQYNYLAGKEMVAVLNMPAFANRFRLREWAARNVSGLRVNRVTAHQPAASVVLFHDRYSTFHSEPRSDIYLNPRDANYAASYGFLDGHAESRSYRNVNEYLAVFHGPIPQTWFGVDFKQAMPEQYPATN